MIRRRAPLRRLSLKERRQFVQAPKPQVKPKSKPKPIARRKRIKFGNAYTHPEVRRQTRRIRKRSKGVCEAQLHCGGAPAEGDPHHLSYAPFKGWKRLIVADDQLVHCCHDCHVEFENRKRINAPVEISFLDDEA